MSEQGKLKQRMGAWAAVVAAAVLVPLSGYAQVGTISGTTIAQDGAQLSAVQISLTGTLTGALSDNSGAFTLANVPVGTYTVVAQRLGYAQTRQENVTVTEGGTVNVEFVMSRVVLGLQEIVAVGLIDPVEGARSPISVGRISRETMPVMVGSGSAVQNLQGMVPGASMARRGGQPGEEVGIMLRSPTSVMQSGQPMVVVDGVILGSGSANIESLDIQSIEVVRGAAAASLYGSRAANGVIAITTNRGDGIDLNSTQVTVRSEIGRSSVHRGQALSSHHPFLVDNPTNPTTYVDANGNPVPRTQRVRPNQFEAFQDKPFPGGNFDNIANLYQGGAFESTSFSLLHNAGTSNVAISAANLRESGVLTGNDGYRRTSFRVNVDQRFTGNVSVGISAFHSRDSRDEADVPFTTILQAPPDVDLRRRDPETGEYFRVPDPMIAYENPLWTQANREGERNRARTLGSANIRWDPRYFISFSTNLSYDREDRVTRTYVPKGTPLSVTQDLPSDGQLSYDNGMVNTYNAEAQVSLRRDFGDLNFRTTFRGLLERQDLENTVASASNFSVGGTPRLNLGLSQSTQNLSEEIRALGYLVDTALDYGGKYIGTVLLRRDGSSLFGPDNRWHTYYRGAFAWRLAEEDWFNIDNVDEFKLSYARGTAGGRPQFGHQYETWTVGASGQVQKGALGNRDLAPEFTMEQEVSLEAILLGRFGLDLTYAWHRTEDQIVNARLPAHTGYATQWANGGVVTGQTWEASLEAALVQTPGFSYTMQLMFDHSQGKIEEWPFACLSPGQRRWCAGAGIYDLQVSPMATRPGELADHDGGALLDRRDEFMVDDEGWLVWVGQGGHYMQENPQWGTSVQVNGETYFWGEPFYVKTAQKGFDRRNLASNFDMNMGSMNIFRLGNVSFHAHLHASFGKSLVDGYHRSLGSAGRTTHPRMDQNGKPDVLKKPVRYYAGIAQRGGNAHQEPGDYLKLRSLGINYSVPQSRMAQLGLGRLGVSGLSVGLVGRNLMVITNYPGPDPEQAFDYATRNFGSSNAYPSDRTITGEFSLTF